jgi:hypothetical protein
MKWWFFFIAVVSLITLPKELVLYLGWARQEPILYWTLPISFTIRIALTAWFLRLWWVRVRAAQPEKVKG